MTGLTRRLYAGIDAGTQSIKVVVYNADAKEIVAQTSASLTLISAADGSREQHASDWLAALYDCFAAIDQTLRESIVALAVSGQQHGFVPVGKNDQVLAPVKLWCDTSTTAECDEIMQSVGGAQACIALTGNPIAAGYTASKVTWTKRHRPDAYRVLDAILLPHDYLNLYLTGERFCEYGDASGTGWLDVRTRRWSSELLNAIDPQRDLHALLPPLVEPGQIFTLRKQAAQALGLPVGISVTTGGGDNMMAAIGTGCVAVGNLAMSLGTSGTLFTYADRPIIDSQGAWAAFCSSTGGWLPLICTMNCTVATESVAKMFGFDSRNGDQHLNAVAPGADGLSMLPFFNGERTPDLPNARAVLHGMDLNNTTAAHIYRAAAEGATYTLRFGFDAFAATGLTFNAITLTGGGSRSASWRQMIADVFDLPVQVPLQSESAAFGAALQALWADQRVQGDSRNLSEVVGEHLQFDQTIQAIPIAPQVDAYHAPYQRFLDHLNMMRAHHAGAASSR